MQHSGQSDLHVERTNRIKSLGALILQAACLPAHIRPRKPFIASFWCPTFDHKCRQDIPLCVYWYNQSHLKLLFSFVSVGGHFDGIWCWHHNVLYSSHTRARAHTHTHTHTHTYIYIYIICEGGVRQQRNDGGGCATMRERPESVESPGTYVTKWV